MGFKILHTNDIHSCFSNYCRIVTKINELRDENTFVFDAGDFHDFKSLILKGTEGTAGSSLLAAGGYDCIAIGNNETNEGADTLEHMAVNSSTPFLSCNIVRKDFTKIKGVQSYRIIHKNGVRFLIIGATPCHREFYRLFGLDCLEYKDEIEKILMNNKDMYDVSILVSHLGDTRDEELAENIHGLDFIIGGHFHTLMDNIKIINDTIIHESGHKGEHLGVIEFEFKDGKVDILRAENISVKECEPNNSVCKLLKELEEKALDNLSERLYDVNSTLWHDVIEENPSTNLLADAFRDLANADIGIANSGLLLGGIVEGALSKKKIFDISPSPLNVTYMEVKGEHIKQALALSLKADHCLSDGKGPGVRGKFAGRLHISGAEIIHDGKKIIDVFINDEKMEDHKWYSLGTTDNLERGSGYTPLKENKNVRYYVEFVSDIIETYCKKENYVDNAHINRWIHEDKRLK